MSQDRNPATDETGAAPYAFDTSICPETLETAP